MNTAGSFIYAGRVVHQRVRPRRHRLSYGVFSLCLDVDEIDHFAATLPLFSRNRFNLVAFHDRDHGSGDGTPVGDHARRLLATAGLAIFGARIRLVCYPRLFGYAFNPLSVYFCENENGRLGAIIYEVNNTFGERRSYVIPAIAGNGPIVRQACAKEMYFSPFTQAEGRYTFHIRPPSVDSDELVIGVSFHDHDGAVLSARFCGRRRPLSASTLLRALAGYPLMTLKVIAGIYLEAARLWSKGVPLVARHVSPSYAFTVVGPAAATSSTTAVDV